MATKMTIEEIDEQIKKLEETKAELKKEAKERLEAQREARKKEVDEAYHEFEKLLDAFVKDYGYYTGYYTKLNSRTPLDNVLDYFS